MRCSRTSKSETLTRYDSPEAKATGGAGRSGLHLKSRCPCTFMSLLPSRARRSSGRCRLSALNSTWGKMFYRIPSKMSKRSLPSSCTRQSCSSPPRPLRRASCRARCSRRRRRGWRRERRRIPPSANGRPSGRPRSSSPAQRPHL